MIFRVMTAIAVILSVSVGASAQLYVSAQTGNNGNDGSKGSPVKKFHLQHRPFHVGKAQRHGGHGLWISLHDAHKQLCDA